MPKGRLPKPYPKTRMNKVERAWIAGIYEGEGCLSQHKRDGQWAIAINMSDEDVINRIKETVGFGKVSRPYAHKNHKLTWYYTIHSRAEIHAFIANILPWLGTRRRENAQRFLDWYETKGHYND